jgi:hypothetical protein
VNRPYALVPATALAFALGAGQAAAATSASPTRPAVAHGSIGKAAPSPGAAARIRALGLDDDGGPGSDDGGDGGLTFGGRVAHGTIGGAVPGRGAAARIRALGLDD